VAALISVLATARAEVTASAPDGFVVTQTYEIGAPPARVWRELVRVGRWWSSEHTYSKNARNLRLEARAGGCWCERWGANNVEHGRAIFVGPGQLLRIEGAFGPMQGMGLHAVMDFTLTEANGATRLTFTQHTIGASLSGLDQIAPAVDGVTTQQLTRLKRLVETGAPE
jgi:uncharacterized protein YndB with AHSA1/START domain